DQSTRHLQWYYPAKFGDNAVRVRQVDEDNEQWHWSEWQWLRKDAPSEPFSLEELFTRRPIAEVVVSYIVIGFEHIVPKGTDHILFILGLFLLSTRMKPLLWQVTMFTVAHTLTLALSMKGVVNLPDAIVEPLIALSIAYVGIENMFAHALHKSRLVLVFLFGLLHGLGFAGVLSEFGMPANAFATALISFNVGVELGQIIVIVMAYLLVGIWFREKPWYRKRIIVPASLAISVIGLYWTYDRIVF
ncbi:MAG: HupE/UreJ family protein, partial [Gammaproteobacteria bacterium]